MRGPLATGLIALILLGACVADREEFVDRSKLLSDPAANVRFPNAVELAHVAAERTTTSEGPQSPFDGYILGTDASAEEVRSYYDAELERLGWTREATRVRSTAELAAWWWCRDRLTYRLAIKDQAKAFQPDFYGGRTFVTVFDATLLGRSRGTHCPSVSSPLPT